MLGSGGTALVHRAANGSVTGWDPAAGLLFGFGPADLGAPADRLMPVEDLAEDRQSLVRLARGEVLGPRVVRRTTGGVPTAVRVEATALRDRSGRLLGVSELVTDADAPLPPPAGAVPLAQVADLLESLPVGALVVDAQGLIVAANARLEVVTGHHRTHLLGAPVETLLPAPLREGHRAKRAGYARGGAHSATVAPRELEAVRADGTPYLVQVGLSPLAAREGQFVLATLVDTTERHLLQRELRAGEERFRHLVESLPQLVWRCTADGVCEYVSPRWTEYTGRGEAELLQHGWVDCVHPDDRPAVAVPFDTLTSPSATFRAELRLRRHDGTWRWFESRAVPQYDATGRAVRWVGTNTDVHDAHVLRDSLRARDEQMERLVATLPGVVYAFRLGPDGRQSFPFASGALVDFLGVEPATVRDDAGPAFATIHPADLERVVTTIAASAVSLDPWHVQFRVQHPTRGEVWIDGHSRPVREPDGGTLWQGYLSDVTELKRREEALGTFRTQLLAAHEAGGLGTWTWDLTTSEVTGSSDATGPRRGGMLDALSREPGVLPAVHPSDRARVSREIEAQLASDVASIENDFRVVTGAGDVRWLTLRGRVERDEAGRARRVLGVYMDITDRKRSEDALRASEERFRQLAESVSEMFWLTDGPKERMLYVSSAYEAIFQRTCASLYEDPRSWLDAVHPDDRARVGEAVRTKQAEGTYDEEYRILRPDGSVRWIRDRAFPVHDADGRLIRLAGVAEDVTDRLRLEAQLRQAQKMESVGKLAGGVAHDFNNLLTVISGSSEYLLTSLRPDDPAVELVQEIRHAGIRAAALTRQLLAFSRQEVVDARVLDLNATVRDTEKMLRRLLGEDVLLGVALSRQDPQVKIDSGQLVQILMNLAVNARDAMPTGGRLTLETQVVLLDGEYVRQHPGSHPGRHALLAVSDTGSGMSREVREHLFEPFFTTKAPGRGTGLGLAVTHGIITQAGGTVEVYSEPGLGSTFKIYLPLVESAATAALAQQGRENLRGTETVLLVEDDLAVRRVARRGLMGHGYQVIEAGDGREALELLARRGGQVEAIVTDVVMPGMDGRQLAEAVKGLFPKVKVIYTSGYTDDAVVRHGVLQAEVAFLQKPYTPPALVRRLRDLLDHREG